MYNHIQELHLNEYSHAYLLEFLLKSLLWFWPSQLRTILGLIVVNACPSTIKQNAPFLHLTSLFLSANDFFRILFEDKNLYVTLGRIVSYVLHFKDIINSDMSMRLFAAKRRCDKLQYNNTISTNVWYPVLTAFSQGTQCNFQCLQKRILYKLHLIFFCLWNVTPFSHKTHA